MIRVYKKNSIILRRSKGKKGAFQGKEEGDGRKSNYILILL
jgi:hypothetical protein